MKCIIPGTNARVFAKAIQSLAKIGTEIFIEADDKGLSIRTVSATKAAFAMIRFDPNFFNDFETQCNSDDEFANKCKVSMKACIGVFRNMKQVELCKINIDSANSKLIVQLKCRLETIKTHSISILDFETLQAVYMTDNVPNMLTGSHKLFGEISNNFQMNEEEITLEAGSDSLTIKNYVEGSHVDRRFMRSQLSLKADEFDKYQIGEETSITFCLREFRAMLGFAESINMDLTVNFENAGRPVVFVLNNLHTFEANLVMSTLSPEDITQCDISLHNQSKTDARKRTSEASDVPSLSEAATFKRARPNFSEATSVDDELFNFPRQIVSESVDIVRGNPRSNVEKQISLPVPVDRDSDILVLPEHTESEGPLVPVYRDSDVLVRPETTESEGPIVTFKDTDEIADQDCIPKSPTAVSRARRVRVLRTVFKRCFEPTINMSDLTGANQILAVSSDTED